MFHRREVTLPLQFVHEGVKKASLLKSGAPKKDKPSVTMLSWTVWLFAYSAFIVTCSPTVSAQTEPDAFNPRNPTLCSTKPCYQWITDALGWEAAQERCRSLGGFLANFVQIEELLKETERRASSIWTGLTKYNNHYQWLTEYAEYADYDSFQWDPTPAGMSPGPWLEGCPALNMTSHKFHVRSCSDLLSFACFNGILDEGKRISSDVQMRVSYKYGKGGPKFEYDSTTSVRLNISESAFKTVYLTCNFYNKTSGERLDKENFGIRWFKDAIYLQDKEPEIKIIDIQDDLKQGLIPIDSPIGDKLPIKQGTYRCASWLARTNQRVVSNEVVVTINTVETYVISVKRIEPFNQDPDIKTLTPTLGDLFRIEIRNWNILTKNKVDILREELNNGSHITTYNLQVYLVKQKDTDGMLARLNKKLQERYPNSSSVKLPNRCSKEKDEVGFGSVLEWPDAALGPVSSEKIQCRASNGLPAQGTCGWNFSKGAILEKPSTEQCVQVGKCPRGYSSVQDIYCVTITSTGSWETGLRQTFKTSKESNLLDVLKQSVTNVKLFEDVLRKERNVSATWLPIRRVTKHSPLVHMGYTSSNFSLQTHIIDSSYKVSWAPGHPLVEKDCLALDLVSLQLSSLDCNQSLPFMSILDVSMLESDNSRSFFDHSDYGCTENGGFNPAYNTDTRTCITANKIRQPSSWRKAYELCDGNLPQPGRGFMTWIYQKLLEHYSLSAVYMIIGNEKDGLPINDSLVEYYNWKAGTNLNNSFGIVHRDGWTLRNDSMEIITTQFCEKKLEMYTDDKISLSQNSTTINVIIPHMSNTVRNSLKCFINGRIVETNFLKNDKIEINMEDNQFGYYECYAWDNNPVRRIQSNKLLSEPSSSFETYFIKMFDRSATYQASLHDSTYFSPRDRTRCQDVLLGELEKYETLGNITASTIVYTSEKTPERLFEIFSLQVPYSRSVPNTVEDAFSFHFANQVLPISFLETNCSILQIRKTRGCPGAIVTDPLSGRSMTFDRTNGSGNVSTNELCLDQDGVPVTRQCLADDFYGFYWDPTFSGQCLTPSSEVVTRLPEIQKNLTNGFSDLVKVTSNSTELRSVDIMSTVNTLNKILTHNTVNKEQTVEVKFKALVSIADNLFAANASNYQSFDSNLNITNKFLTTFEELSFSVQIDSDPGDSSCNESRTWISAERIDITVDSLIAGYTATQWDDVDQAKTLERNQVDSMRQGVQAEIIFPHNLPRSLFHANDNSTSSKLQILFTVIRSPNMFLVNRSSSNSSNSFHHVLNSHVIQASFRGHQVQDLDPSDPVKLRFASYTDDNRTVCGFWNFTENNALGAWSTQGCSVGERSGSLVTCRCTHLTSFALLIRVDSVKIEKHHHLILDTITYVGCCLSIFGLLMIFLTFTLFKSWRQSKSNKILVNLSIAVFFSLTIFLGGINKGEHTTLCRIVALSLHYFILASFCWMAVEAFHQYLRFVIVIGGYIPRFMLKASVFAWGLPMVPVIILLIVDDGLYESRGEYETTTKICWISQTAFNYAFLPPLALAMLVNMVFYILIVKNVCKKSQVRSNLKERDLIIKKVNMAVCVFFLLGFTWLFGFLMFIENSRTVFAYLFSIFNTMQGFSIFVFFVWREKSARGKWSDLFAVIKQKDEDSNQVRSAGMRVVRLELEANTMERSGLVDDE